MPSTDELVETNVDLLVSLVKKRREISFDEASKLLGVPYETIESWANFLEEEGIVSIKYKFTTPFIIYAEGTIKKGSGQNVDQKLNEIFFLLDKAENHVKKNEFEILEKVFNGIHTEMKNVSSLIELEHGMEHTKKQDGIQKLLLATELMNEASDARKKGNLQEVKETYEHLHKILGDIYENFKKATVDRRVLASDTQVEKLTTKNDVPRPIEHGTDIESMLSTAYEYLKLGDVQKAQQIYVQIDKMYNHLSEEYHDRKDGINKQMVKLNRDLSMFIDRIETKKSIDKSREIVTLVQKANELIKEKRLDEANAAYERMELIYSEMPEGFMSKKVELEKVILDVRELLIKEQEVQSLNEFTSKQKAIMDNLEVIKQKISQKDIINATEIYENTKRIYDGLPVGFLSEKIILQESIFDVYKQLINTNKDISFEDLTQKSARILELLSSANNLIDKKDLSSATEYSVQIRGMFNELPPGFLKEKTSLQNKILSFSRRLSEEKEKSALITFHSKQERIEKMIITIEDYIKNQEFDLAKETYSEIVRFYSMIPEGFLKEKTELRTRILLLYKKVMTNVDTAYLSNVNDATKMKYEKLLKLIVKIQEHIDQHEFELIEVNYNHIVSLYNELPIGFVQQKISIRDEIIKIYDILQLYKKLQEWELYTKNNDPQAAKTLESIKKLHAELSEHCVEFKEILNYVKDKINAVSPSPDPIKESSKNTNLGTKDPVPVKATEIFAIKDLEKKIGGTVKEPILSKDKKIPAPLMTDDKAPSIVSLGHDKIKKIREIHNSLLSALSANDFDLACEDARAMMELDLQDTKAAELHRVLSRLNSLDQKTKKAVCNLIKYSFDKAKISVEGELLKSKLIRGLDSYFKNDTKEASRDFNKVAQIVGNLDSQTLIMLTADETNVKSSIESTLIKMKLARAKEDIQKKNFKQAATDLKKVLEIDNDNEQAKSLLAQIKVK